MIIKLLISINNLNWFRFLYSFPSMVTSYTFQNRLTPTQSQSSCLCSAPDTLDISIHDGLCCRSLLFLIRVLSLIALCMRFALNVKDNYQSLFSIVEFLTYFGFILTFLYFTFVVQDYLLNEFRTTKTSPEFKNSINLLFEIAFCLEVPITILYWYVIYTPGDDPTTFDLIKDIGNHGFPLATLLLDFCFNSYRFPFRHLPAVLGAAIFYLFVNLVYTLKVEKIYSAIDWTSTDSYIYVVAAVALVGLIHCLGQILWYCFKRNKIESSCKVEQIAQISVH